MAIVLRVRSLALTALLVGGTASAASLPTADWLLDEVRVLSAPENEGRAAGTPGADRAAGHIARVFQEAGLRPGGDDGGFFQRFTVPTGIRLGPRNTMTLTGPGSASLALGRDFTPLPVSDDGVGEADLVFAGYGITAPDLHYDDYAGLDVRGKIVLVLTQEPRSQDPASPFRRPEAYHYSERAHKVINARQHGARAILLVSPPSPSPDTLPPLQGISQPWGILAAYLSRGAGNTLLAPAGRSLADLAGAIDRTMTPHSLALPAVHARLEVTLVREHGTTANVVGILPGTDATRRDETIVIGAHYDHLGRGGEGSLAPDRVGTIHPGADDNASGTAAVLGLARSFATAGGVPRTLVFVAFSGEEMGLLGSSHYVKHPARPLEHTVLMVNLDMVGRLREHRLHVSGADSGTGLRALVTGVAQGSSLVLDVRGDPYAPSDHTSFYTAGRPVVFLFAGAHPDYHRPGDTWDRINAGGLAEVAGYAERLVSAVARGATPPAYVKVEGSPSRGRASGSGYGPFFGAIPEFGASDRPGVTVSGVRGGSPAERAGVREGDRLVRFGGLEVRTLEDFAFALRSRRPGDRVEVVVVRGGREETLEAVLEERH